MFLTNVFIDISQTYYALGSAFDKHMIESGPRRSSKTDWQSWEMLAVSTTTFSFQLVQYFTVQSPILYKKNFPPLCIKVGTSKSTALLSFIFLLLLDKRSDLSSSSSYSILSLFLSLQFYSFISQTLKNRAWKIPEIAFLYPDDHVLHTSQQEHPVWSRDERKNNRNVLKSFMLKRLFTCLSVYVKECNTSYRHTKTDKNSATYTAQTVISPEWIAYNVSKAWIPQAANANFVSTCSLRALPARRDFLWCLSGSLENQASPEKWPLSLCVSESKRPSYLLLYCWESLRVLKINMKWQRFKRQSVQHYKYSVNGKQSHLLKFRFPADRKFSEKKKKDRPDCFYLLSTDDDRVF